MADKTPSEQRDRDPARLSAHRTQDLARGRRYSATCLQTGRFCVCYSADTLEEAERVFGALGEGAIIQMPLQQTFWTPGFGMLTDQFGIPWMVNTNQAPGS